MRRGDWSRRTGNVCRYATPISLASRFWKICRPSCSQRWSRLTPGGATWAALSLDKSTSVVAHGQGSGIGNGKDPSRRRANRADRPEGISGNRNPEAGEGGRDTDRSDVCVDGGGPGAIPKEPGCGLLFGATAAAQRIRRKPA